jgi:hypothetical protein
MREVFFLDWITPEDYEAIRGLQGSDLPDTYDEWFKLHTTKKIERGHVGDTVELVRVYPHEFIRYCRGAGAAATGHSLNIFAQGRGAGKIY